jgi:hypothetical protein
MTAGKRGAYDIQARTRDADAFKIEKCATERPTLYAFVDESEILRCYATAACRYQAQVGEKFPWCIKNMAKAVQKASEGVVHSAPTQRAPDTEIEYRDGSD